MAAGQWRDDHHPGRVEEQFDLVCGQRPLHRHVGEQEGLPVGGSDEADAGLLAHDAVHAVGADHVAGGDPLAALQGDATLVDGGDRARPADVAAEFAQPGREDRLGRALRDHQRVRILRRQAGEVQAQQGFVALPDGEASGDQARVDHPPAHVEVFQHLQGAGVHDGGARGVGPFRLPVQQHRVDAPGAQRDSQGEPGRPGSHDHHIGVHDSSRIHQALSLMLDPVRRWMATDVTLAS